MKKETNQIKLWIIPTLTLAVLGVMLMVGLLPVGTASARTETFTAHLSGAEQVPPFDTAATGQALFHFNSRAAS